MERELTLKEKEILVFLREKGEQIEYRIAFGISSGFLYTKKYLEHLAELNLIVKREIGYGTRVRTYWRVI